MAERKLEKVYLEWTDAAGREGWENVEHVLQTDYKKPVVTIGFILKEDKIELIITGSYDECNDNCLSYIVIPKSAIRKRMRVELIK